MSLLSNVIVLLPLVCVVSWVRHNKGKKLVQAFNSFPEVAFDTRDVLVQYLDDFGTQVRLLTE